MPARAPASSRGAYSHPVTSERHPYVFLNHMGERRDVLTLAHERRRRPPDPVRAPGDPASPTSPLFLAETASIFGEGLVFERLLAQATGVERKALLAGKIEDGLNTAVRQIAFHRFETQFHAASRRGRAVRRGDRRDMAQGDGRGLGPAIKLNDGYEFTGPTSATSPTRPSTSTPAAFGDLLRGLMEASSRRPGRLRRSTKTCWSAADQDLRRGPGLRPQPARKPGRRG